MAKRGNGRSPKSQPDCLLVAHVSDLEPVDGVIYPPVGRTYPRHRARYHDRSAPLPFPSAVINQYAHLFPDIIVLLLPPLVLVFLYL